MIDKITATESSDFALYTAFLLLFFLITCSQIVNADDEVEESDSSIPWYDRGHSYFAEKSNSLANWIDSFFGQPRQDLESARSSLRIKFSEQWQESEGTAPALRIRGKVHLPKLNERLSLVFTDEEKSEDEEDLQQEAAETSKAKNTAALQYNLVDDKKSRLDFNIGLRSSLKLKTSARWRYTNMLNDHTLGRFVETVYFRDGEGFGSRSVIEFDRIINDNRLIRWSNRLHYAEKTQGMEWYSTIINSKRLDDKRALSSFIWVEGHTEPEDLTTSYGIGMRYRRNAFRPWFFYELEPAYAWIQDRLSEPRDDHLLLNLRIEILIEK